MSVARCFEQLIEKPWFEGLNRFIAMGMSRFNRPRFFRS